MAPTIRGAESFLPRKDVDKSDFFAVKFWEGAVDKLYVFKA